MSRITPFDWQRMSWHPKARIVADLTRAANDLRDEIDALEARRAQVDPAYAVATARARRVGLPDDPHATRHWRELGMLCDRYGCDGFTRRGGLCEPCSDRARHAS